MPTFNARSAASSGIPAGTRGPDDDFFCHKYQVWYRIEDCVFRGRNRTFSGCVNCFQGTLNIRSVEKGTRPPVHLGPIVPGDPLCGNAPVQGEVLPFGPRAPRNGTSA